MIKQKKGFKRKDSWSSRIPSPLPPYPLLNASRYLLELHPRSTTAKNNRTSAILMPNNKGIWNKTTQYSTNTNKTASSQTLRSALEQKLKTRAQPSRSTSSRGFLREYIVQKNGVLG